MQVVRVEHAADEPAAHLVAFGLRFGPQSAGAVALAVVRKRFAHRHLSGRFSHWHLRAELLDIIDRRGYAQGLAALAVRHLTGPLGDVLVVLTGWAGRK